MILETTVALILIFSALVIFHEFGHFIAARKCGIRVDEFAIGFGPKLFSFGKRGDTEYTIHAIPAGGFVKLAGMDPEEEGILDGFQAQSIGRRAITIFAGPFASFVLAMVVFVSIGIFWGFPDFVKIANRVGGVMPQTEAARMGLRAGDRILEINGVPVTQGQEMINIIHDSAGKQLRMLVDRHGNKITLTGTPKWHINYGGVAWSFENGSGKSLGAVDTKDTQTLAVQADDKIISVAGKSIKTGSEMLAAIKAAGDAGMDFRLERRGQTVQFHTKPRVVWVRLGSAEWAFPGGYSTPATRTKAIAMGFEAEDKLISVNGRNVKTGEEMLSVLRSAKSGSVAVEVERNDEKIVVSVSLPDAKRQDVPYGLYKAQGLLGFIPEPALAKVGFVPSVTRGVTDTWAMVTMIVTRLFSKSVKEDVGGPIMIAKIAQSQVALGPYYVFGMLGSLSLSLSIINLIPIPIVDGGHLVILGVEAIRRKRLTSKQMNTVMAVGFAIVMMLFVTVVFSDIFKITRGLVPQ